MTRRDSTTTTRRAVVKAAAATAVAGSLTAGTASASATSLPAATRSSEHTGPLFLHGVASGDPLPDGVLLWTRVTPTPDARPGSGLGPDTEVGWEVAADRGFTRILARGSSTATTASDHTVKVDVRGLGPATVCYYRFSAQGAVSPVGRTRTAPAEDAAVSRLRFGVASCANWESGYFAAYRHLAARTDLDAVVHLGDYIYEYGTGRIPDEEYVIRRHQPTHEILTLADYRLRHGTYKTDADLQAMHAAHPLVAIWDDHEIANNNWSGGAENHTPGGEGDYAARAAAAKRAYFEWMPVRASTAGTVYRRLRFGTLADLHLLDLRSFRSQQATVGSKDVDDPDRTITGRAQLDWLKSGLESSRATWRLVGTSVMISPIAFGSLPAHLLAPLAELLGVPREGLAVNVDQWDGYTDDRRELLGHLVDRGIENTVFLTGDIHTAWANDVPVKAATYPLSASAASEFVVASVTTENLDDVLRVAPGTVSVVASGAVRLANRHVKWVDMDNHGYGVLDVTADRSQMDYYTLSDRTKADATVSWARSYRTRSGTQRVERVDAPVV
ncbi:MULTISPECIES: alkaline phosphatase D family protein [unclassified Streptomyces]|uniref:alkaline phosphatase D family protein n=1 Tax=unclassified Streptomyces TaxID=2593676 RepID=UPI00190797FB|nr:alkaline phosphatase D family protein [Streptomyces sp. HSG2]